MSDLDTEFFKQLRESGTLRNEIQLRDRVAELEEQVERRIRLYEAIRDENIKLTVQRDALLESIKYYINTYMPKTRLSITPAEQRFLAAIEQCEKENAK